MSTTGLAATVSGAKADAADSGSVNAADGLDAQRFESSAGGLGATGSLRAPAYMNQQG